MPAPLLRHLVDPRFLRQETRRIGAKIARRVRKTDHQVVQVPPVGTERGRAVLSYIVDPLLPGAPAPGNTHTHFWESLQIASALAEHGLRVDAVHWTNQSFLPDPGTDVLIDVRTNLERWVDHAQRALKVAHLDTCHYRFNNDAQAERHRALTARRGVTLRPVKLMPENRVIETCDVATYLGNDVTRNTYAFAGKEMHRIPVSVPETYDELDRNWDAARRRFLWFGSGGLVHKGLDLVLEAFAELPELHLTVCGPISAERDFDRHYRRELYGLPNVETLGWVDTGSPQFVELARRTGFLLYPSCAEGGGASVLTCMHAGIVPVLTPEASVDLASERGVLLDDVRPDALRERARALAEQPPPALRELSRNAREWARAHHSREVFTRRYDAFARQLVARL